MPSLYANLKLEFRGLGHERPSALNRTPMENGMVKQTKVRTRVLVRRSMTGYLDSNAYYLAFMAWFRDDIDEGATWFTFTDPTDATSKLGRIVAGTLKDIPLNPAFTMWRVTFDIEHWSG